MENHKTDELQAPFVKVAFSVCVSGVIAVTLPGLSILVTGVVFVALTASASNESHLADGMCRLAVVIVTVGGAWTLLALGFWISVSLQHRLRRTSTKTATRHDDTASNKSSVQLVAVSWADADLFL